MTSNPDEFRTRRLVPRRVGPGDLAAVTAVTGGPETNLHNPAGPASPDMVAAQPEEWQAHRAREGIGHWAVVPPEAEEVIGFGGLRIHELNGEGQGYLPEMARAAIEWANRARPDRSEVIVTVPRGRGDPVSIHRRQESTMVT